MAPSIASAVSRWAGYCLILFLAFVTLTASANAQFRDYMTEEEIELVREAQDIDLRITVLTRMIDRRFTALGLNPNGWVPKEKDIEKWGPAPTGSRTELFSDIRRLLEKAIDDLDVIAERSGDALKQNQTTGELFPVAVGLLESAARRYGPILAREAEKAEDERIRGLVLTSAQHCDNIIAAAGSFTPEQKDPKRKRPRSKDAANRSN